MQINEKPAARAAGAAIRSGTRPSAARIQLKKATGQLSLIAETENPEWAPKKVDTQTLPDQPNGNSTPPPTIANVRYLLEQNGIQARYNVISKKFEIAIPGLSGVIDNGNNVALAHIKSLLALHGMPSGDVRGAVDAIANQSAYNPVEDWIRSKPWDGRDRLPDYYSTIETRPDYPVPLKETLMRKWLLSATAAALMPSGFSTRGVLLLQGAQSIGKTRWGMSLVSNAVLRAEVVKTDHHFDGSKDSIIGAIRYWLVEFGEFESSQKKDKERLKGFITRDRDSIRLPYAAAESELPRRTVFWATANGYDFLTDQTGATRLYVIEVQAIDYQHGIDMQQLFSQLAADFDAGAKWWLDANEESQLEAWNYTHQAISIVSETVREYLDLDGDEPGEVAKMSALEVLEAAGMENPKTMDARDCGAILRKHFGDPKKIRGKMKWSVVLRAKEPEPEPAPTKSKYD